MKKRTKTLKRLSRPFRHALAYYIIKSLIVFVKKLPLAWSQALGRFIGIICAVILHKQSKLIKAQLSHTLYKDLSTISDSQSLTIQDSSANLATKIATHRSTIANLERAHWIDLGQRLCEWFSAQRALALFRISPQQKNQLQLIQEQAKLGKAQVILSAHFAHWELMAVFLSQQGFSYIAVASALPKGPFGKWLATYRKELGVHVIHPNGGAKKLKKAFQRGTPVALLIDHSTYERSIESVFLGQKAPLSLTADRLISKFDADVHWLSNYRDEQGHYQIILQELNSNDDQSLVSNRELEHTPKPNLNENVLITNPLSLKEQKRIKASYTILAHQILEKQIQQWPKQWLWLHQKWKARQNHY